MIRSRSPRQFRSITLNAGTHKGRTIVFMTSLTVAAMLIFLCMMAVQLVASGNGDSFAARIVRSASSQSLHNIMGQEIPLYASADPNRAGVPNEPSLHIASMLFYLFTEIDAEHPESILNRQISAMAVSHSNSLTEGFDEPPAEDKLPETPDQHQPPPETEQPNPMQPDGKPLVYIYHTHNREAYLPDLGLTDPLKAYDKNKNITLVGERLLKSLKSKNIEAIQTKNDYWYKGNIQNEYDLSRKTVQEVLKQHDSIKMVFDIHRDSGSRGSTTAQINGQDVAKVFFIIGGSNPNWQENSEFAKKLHAKLQQMYPGLSKGVHKNKWDNPAYDSRYNQDLFKNSVLIEIGGPDNTLEECYRTADMLANVIAEAAKDKQTAAGNQGRP
ncbi:stage II sporulation protein P [Effusibacillus pohliae]|uniref:stage II sporulation protein P n=1 Tax=Effusibacillus pohliae TaxID=232270 RepID=UPI000380DBF1|nr:stage II sporulation protein P [Effusibacillus pohliae]